MPASEATLQALEPFESHFPGFHRDRLFYNMSVWENLEALRAYTFQSAHAELLNERHQWVDSIAGASVALWWIPIGHIPTVEEAKARLRHLAEQGPTAHAFTFRALFPPPDAESSESVTLDARFCEWAT